MTLQDGTAVSYSGCPFQMGFRQEAQFMRWQSDMANGVMLWNPLDAPAYAMQGTRIVTMRKERDNAAQQR